LQDRQDESRSFAGAGLRQSYNVAALENDRDRLTLDRCWGCETGGLDRSGDMRIERKLFEIQRLLLDSIEPSCNLSPM
jgi:hypothetical protein